MSPIEAHRVACEQPPHYHGNRCIARPEQQVEVVGNQSPTVAGRGGFGQDMTEPLNKVFAIGIILENLSALYPPADDVV